MALKSRRNQLNKQKRSRNQQKNKRSRRLNQNAGGDSVCMLYVNMNKDKKPEKYELILVADNIQDLKIWAKDVSPNMISSFKDEVNNYMYVQVTKLNGQTDTTKIRKLDLSKFKYERFQSISSEDESTLYYTYDCSGLVLAIYNNREDIERAFPEADIKSIKKNNFDWKLPLFR